MIFVMLGTQKQQFTRLLDLISNSSELENNEIIVQSGNTKYDNGKLKMFEFVSPEDMEKYIQESDFVITHGGVGSILTALKMNKKILAVPRLEKYKEHVNNHQVQICTELEKQGNLLCYKENDNFDEDILMLKEKEFKKYVSDKSYLDKLRAQI